MPIDVDAVLSWEFPVAEVAYDERDSMLYALGVGLGADPLDRRELRFVYEKELVAFPTMAVVLGHPGPWFSDPRTGIDWVRAVHGEQELRILAPLRPADDLRCTTRVTGVVDKGPGRGALVHWERELVRADTAAPVAVASSVLFCRGDGGHGGSATGSAVSTVRPLPERPPDQLVDRTISPRAALLYRLSGDRNPLHADPDVAAEAGFDRPILHGLCTFGMAAVALVAATGDADGSRLRGMGARFSAPSFPGETLRTEIWMDGDGASFRTYALEREAIVLDGGWVEVVGHG